MNWLAFFSKGDKERETRVIAYHLWQERLQNNEPGNTDSDYLDAEKIVRSSGKTAKHWAKKFDAFKAYEIISQQIDIEYALINNRLGWYVTSQAFLLTAFGVWVGQKHPILSDIAITWLPYLGIGASVAIFLALWGAICTVDKWWRLREYYIDRISPLGKLIYLKRLPAWHTVGLLAPLFFPIAFGLFWFYIGSIDIHSETETILNKLCQ